jgi:hypothetical protein
MLRTWVGNSPLVISEGGMKVSNPQGGNRSAIGSKALSEISPKKWSIRIDRMGSWCGLGVAPENAKTISFTGKEQMWYALSEFESLSLWLGCVLPIHIVGLEEEERWV